MIAVFLGPSLPAAEAQELLPEARLLPPVQQGDVLRLLDEQARGVALSAIAVIDGFFELVPAVWHKELLLALQEGVGVYGASSMGALRAAELHPYGMVGVGRVFEWFRDGVLTDDDEVAVAHGPEESAWRSLSTAMVDLRAAYRAATDAGVIPAATADRLVGIGKAMHYPDRSHPAVLAAAAVADPPVDAVELDALREWLGPRPPSVKADDARLLLRGLRDGTLAASPPARTVRVEDTVFLDQLRTEVAGSLGTGEPVGLEAGAARIGETPDVLRKKATLRYLARREAARLGVAPTDDELREAAAQFLRNSGLWTEAQVAAWMEAEGITDDLWVQFLHDAVLIEKVRRVHERSLERLAADHARISTGKLHGTSPPSR